MRSTHDLLQNATFFRRTRIHPYGRVSHGEGRSELFVQKFRGIQMLESTLTAFAPINRAVLLM